MQLSVRQIAEVAHEINRSYCAAIGDHSQLPWAACPDWQKSSAINGVKFHIANPKATPEQSHFNWLTQKYAEGWRWGAVKDPEAKTHPCCVPYENLPLDQRVKDHLFRATVRTLAGM